MATEKDLCSISRKAAADLSAYQFRAVKLDSSYNIAAVTAATDAVIGVLQNKPGSAETAEVAYAGITKMVASAGLTVGDPVTVNAEGYAASFTEDTTGTVPATKFVLGRALQTASGTAVIFDVLLQVPQALPGS